MAQAKVEKFKVSSFNDGDADEEEVATKMLVS